jgi:hypothetical protein
MGALLAGIGLVQFIGLAISAAGVVLPEIDTVAARRLERPVCYTLLFNRDKSVAWMSPAQNCRKIPSGVALTKKG